MFSSSKSVVSDIQLRRDMDAALSTLLRIQEVIGVPEEEMKEKEMLELGKFKGDEFLLLKMKIMKRLEATQQAIEEFQDMDGGSLPPDVKIRKGSDIRTAISKVTEQWEELDKLYRIEANKKRSKLSQQELVSRSDLKDSIKEHIDALKEDFLQVRSGGRGDGGGGRRPLQNFIAFKADLEAKSKENSGAGIEHENVTVMQDQRLQQLKARNDRQDELINQIDVTVDRLKDKAERINEEVVMQSGMIKALEIDVEKVVEHVESLNVEMKKTLKAVRDNDRVCMDVCCILLFLGMLGVFLQMHNNSKK